MPPMNPHQKNKIDVNSLSPEEQRLFRLYGKLPTRSDHFAKHLKERKYFDSGDYAMSKAGKGDSVDAGSVGSQHPVPENIPHLATPPVTNGPGGGGTPLGIGGGGVGPNGAGGVLPMGVAAGGGGSSGGLHAAMHMHGSISGVGGVILGGQAGSPVKESSFLHRGTSVDEIDQEAAAAAGDGGKGKENGEGQQAGAIPIRR